MGFIIGFIAIFIYFRKNFKIRKQKWYDFVIAGLAFIAYTIASYYIDFGFYHLLLIFAVHVSIYYLAVGMRWIEASFAGTLLLFTFYSTRGVILSIYALIKNQSIAEISNSSDALIISHIASIVGFFILLVFVKFMKREKFVLLFSVKRQTIFLTLYTLIEVCYIYIINQGRYVLTNNIWYSLTYLSTSILSIAVFGYILHNIIRLIKTIENEIYTVRLEEQLDNQIIHYEQYQSYIKELAKFKHDHGNLMKSLKQLIKSNNNEKALELLDESIEDDIFEAMSAIEKTSNSFIVDAIIFDYANKCKINHIDFKSSVKFPNSINFSQLELMKIFSNVLSNALEASIKSPENKRFITISSKAVSNWLVIKISNNYETDIIVEDDQYITSKSDKVLHGFGLRIINDIITKKGGLVKFFIDKNKKVFSVQLSIPKTTLDNQKDDE
ncbi:hypothetical protein, ATPase domain protein [Alteracholeplasma palmae J233]|uniref:Sensor histidine kinase NatK-like C-terminal domain-containing protein n=1 Tax=Alteracholeplasma palmae (strain ATCC 49389 / J233) TaxID=1318466 RepID=U4KLS9_ALTPJ|nr:sensor histidine kinase [Alteracholeplasma palmae]CCV64878.1 hypothetical protein, ATPase domain protein [Alteracholeplasma palmae J233]